MGGARRVGGWVGGVEGVEVKWGEGVRGGVWEGAWGLEGRGRVCGMGGVAGAGGGGCGEGGGGGGGEGGSTSERLETIHCDLRANKRHKKLHPTGQTDRQVKHTHTDMATL